MAQPSEEDIDQIVAFTDFTDRALIALALKVGHAFIIASSSHSDGPC